MHDVPDAKEVYRFTVDQFVNIALRTVNAVCGKRKSVKTIIIGDTINLTVDINRFRKKCKSENLKDKDYRTINGLILGPKAIISV